MQYWERKLQDYIMASQLHSSNYTEDESSALQEAKEARLVVAISMRLMCSTGRESFRTI